MRKFCFSWNVAALQPIKLHIAHYFFSASAKLNVMFIVFNFTQWMLSTHMHSVVKNVGTVFVALRHFNLQLVLCNRPTCVRVCVHLSSTYGNIWIFFWRMEYLANIHTRYIYSLEMLGVLHYCCYFPLVCFCFNFTRMFLWGGLQEITCGSLQFWADNLPLKWNLFTLIPQ